eukprot:CAMPEP_0119491440 /NCGR_PEP_ID=MMETSP1344-20130328/16302_1 /TAXON_ID=236787 /ORGANISM="Florenciella parvula, Strain CCMP2471" /LENGTH=70 /DNA_ID=CAMNT_0007526689 /DNA_START=158 /DNA_END=367 /DNA_ORIENTATION=+
MANLSRLPSIAEVLTRASMEQLMPGLQKLGAEDFEDLLNLEDEDYEDLKVTAKQKVTLIQTIQDAHNRVL